MWKYRRPQLLLQEILQVKDSSKSLQCETKLLHKFCCEVYKKKKKKEIRNHDPIQMSHLEEYLCLMGNCQNC